MRAVGSSMNQANIGGKNIEEDDYVLVDHTDKDIQTNDYILSVIDGMANIKDNNRSCAQPDCVNIRI